MKTLKIFLGIVAISLASCGHKESPTDATGIFEATEVILSAEVGGKLLNVNVDEGQHIKVNDAVALIDTTQLHLNLLQLQANKVAILSGRPDIQTQIAATEREIEKQEFEQQRVEKLLKGDVATQKQLDDINAALVTLKARLKSQQSALQTSVNAINAQAKAIDVQMDLVRDQLAKCMVKSPMEGTVLLKYAESGEITAPGRGICKIADVSKMNLRAYVTSDQLARLKVGQKVNVLAEFGEEELRPYEGVVTWISDKAEFTPKTIQTQDERANLVYAIKIAVENDGYLKIGMYGGYKSKEG